ncbi:MAG: hypothetical protein Q7T48_20570, partial [Cellvibrio sp.]|uniref:hypothetical protein n=1 Tax=Cellvibrio sp. TaxID=1965322 RepID=UPI002727C82B|nr:hypothetical protein [Cellvibrio sp.]
FQKMIEKFIRLTRKATGDAMPYVLTVEKYDSVKTNEAKRGSLHAHVAVKGRQDYKLLQTIWNFRVCGVRGYVRVSNGTRKINPGRIAGYIRNTSANLSRMLLPIRSAIGYLII